MFSGIKRLLGSITVEVVGGVIHVEGVDTEVMAKDIKRIWGTNKINQHLFIQMSKSSFSFPSFFAPDVLYTLEQMVNAKSMKLNVRTLSKIKELLIEKTWLKATKEEFYSKLDLSKLRDLTLTPLDFQSDFFEAYDRLTGQYNLNGFLLAGSAGSGKTFTSLALMHCLDVDRIVVICPKNAVHEAWEKNIKSCFFKPQSYWLSTSSLPFKGTERIVVVHYESLEEAIKICQNFQGQNVGIILDESHNLNGVSSLRTGRFIDLCELTDSRDIVWLSGTPIKALTVEAIPLFRCIDPLFTDDVEKRFKKIYNDSKGRGVEILKNRMGLVSFKVEKSQLGLLKPIFKEIKIQIPNGKSYTLSAIKQVMSQFIQDRHAYYRLRKDMDERFFKKCLDIYEHSLSSNEEKKAFAHYKECLALIVQRGADFTVKDEMMHCNKFELSSIIRALPNEMKGEWKSVRSIIKYVHLKIQGECLGRVLGGLRIQAHVDMVDKIDFKAVCDSTVKKTVVFTSFVQVLEKCQSVMSLLGLNALFVYANTNSNLTNIISRFGQDEDANPLVTTYASLSTAVPLVMADTTILIDSPYRDYILQQTVSRTHRLGSDTQVYVYNVVLDTGDEVNISTRSLDILKWSQDMVEKIMGITSPFELTDNPEAFSVALEGFEEETLSSVKLYKPNFLNW
jgi:SNF2 family DNA or RNA helicase